MLGWKVAEGLATPQCLLGCRGQPHSEVSEGRWVVIVTVARRPRKEASSEKKRRPGALSEAGLCFPPAACGFLFGSLAVGGG